MWFALSYIQLFFMFTYYGAIFTGRAILSEVENAFIYLYFFFLRFSWALIVLDSYLSFYFLNERILIEYDIDLLDLRFLKIQVSVSLT